VGCTAAQLRSPKRWFTLTHCSGSPPLVGNTADADDLVQDTLFRRYRPGISSRAHQRESLAIKILRHVFIDRTIAKVRPPADAELRPPAVGRRRVPVLPMISWTTRWSTPLTHYPCPIGKSVVLRDIETCIYASGDRAGRSGGHLRSRCSAARGILQQKLLAYAVSTGVIKR